MTLARLRRAALLAAAASLATGAALAPAFAQDKPATAPAATAESAPSPEPTADMVVATVNGKKITLAEVIMARASLPQQYQQIPPAQLMPALIDQAVVQTLLADEAEKAGKGEDPLAVLQAEVAKKSWLAEVQMGEVIRAATSDDKLQALYDAQIKDMAPTPEIRASHILVKEKEKADELKAKLDGGADFAELAKENGTDGTKDRGGDLGWFDKEQMVPAFADAAFAAEEGKVVGPVETQFGWHLILVTAHRDRPVPTFEEMKDELAQEAARAAAQAKVEALRGQADVQMSETMPDPSAIGRDDLLQPK